MLSKTKYGEHVGQIEFQLFNSILHLLDLLEFQVVTETIPCCDPQGNHFVHK